MSGCRFRRTAFIALTLSAGLLAASDATAAQASRVDRKGSTVLQELAVSPWTKIVTGYLLGFGSKMGYFHPPGPENKPGSSNAKPEGPGLCPSGSPNPGGN